MNHNRIYLALLSISAPLTGFQCVGLFYWHYSLGESLGHIPAWAIPWMAAANGLYCVGFVITMGARLLKPDLGKRLTRILNWAMLPALIGGTLLGIYGLLKVDREPRQAS